MLMELIHSFGWLIVLSYLCLFLLVWFFVRHLFRLIMPAYYRRFRLKAFSHFHRTRRHLPSWVRWLFVPFRKGVEGHYQELLVAAGMKMDVMVYTVLKRILASVAVILILWFLSGNVSGVLPIWGTISCLIIVFLVVFDHLILEQIGKRRRAIITEEIYSLCHQLSYYAGAEMNVHTKLTRCTSFTGRIRQEWLLLLQEWYEDPEEALYRFRQRIGTEEAYSFAETLSAMRRGESEAFYDLLRQRIADYKESLDLVKEGRKETYSYALFVMAGIPIVNTFRIFIYPWVEEGQKLFQTIQ